MARQKKGHGVAPALFCLGFMLVVRFRNSGVGERLGHLNDRVMPILQRKLDGGTTNAASIDASFDRSTIPSTFRLRGMEKSRFPRKVGRVRPRTRSFREKWVVLVPQMALSAKSGSCTSQNSRIARKVGRTRPGNCSFRDKWDVFVPELADSARSTQGVANHGFLGRGMLCG